MITSTSQTNGIFHRNLQGLILSVRNNDGFESQRVVETKELSQIIQKRIYALQHPKNCPEVKKLVGKLNKGINP